ncbi:Uncharacterised protein [Neisseria weaveri]|uniref:Uncharacterized protein n=1 Tax=Neisseria weaveri TaxID=28091 RepID=A0A448VHM9_9NEIS|nr:hypothetical protein l13_00270 [Neisseria weaveri ATCC 51223]VEJ49277.1 Uncharacterised protein [Neisseria weaveri]
MNKTAVLTALTAAFRKEFQNGLESVKPSYYGHCHDGAIEYGYQYLRVAGQIPANARMGRPTPS